MSAALMPAPSSAVRAQSLIIAMASEKTAWPSLMTISVSTELWTAEKGLRLPPPGNALPSAAASGMRAQTVRMRLAAENVANADSVSEVPGGDPGNTPPKLLMPLLEKQTANLRRYHPNAGMWVAPQGFTTEWLNDFLGIVRAEPKWLSGIVTARNRV